MDKKATWRHREKITHPETNERCLRRNQPHQHLHLGTLASRIMSKYISALSTPQSVVLSYSSPSKLTYRFIEMLSILIVVRVLQIYTLVRTPQIVPFKWRQLILHKLFHNKMKRKEKITEALPREINEREGESVWNDAWTPEYQDPSSSPSSSSFIDAPPEGSRLMSTTFNIYFYYVDGWEISNEI